MPKEPSFSKKNLDNKDDVVPKKRSKKTIRPGSTKGEEERLNRELTEIYENSDGSMPDMSHFETRKRRRALRALVTLFFALALLGGVSYLGFFVFDSSRIFSDDDIILSISGDEDAQSGEEVRYRITYRNAQSIPLAHATLEVRYPQGFVMEGASVEATDEAKTKWELGTLDPQEGGDIEVWGRLFGSLEEKQSLRAFLNYTPSNFSSEFQKVESLTTNIATSSVDLAIDGPTDISLGSEATVSVTVTPKEGLTGPVVVRLVPPADFVLKSSDVPADQNDTFAWTFAELKEPKKITLVGTVASGEKATIGFEAYQWKDANRNVNGYVVGRVQKDLNLLVSDITASLVINGTLNDFSVQPGDTLSATIVVKNVGKTTLTNVTAAATLDAPSLSNQSLLKWAALVDAADGTVAGEQLSAEVRRGIITWTKAQVPGLASLAPGDQVTIDISLPIKNGKEIDLSAIKGSQILATVELGFDKDGKRDTISSNQIRMSVASDTTLEVQHEANDTTHIVRWVISNTSHELQSIVLEAEAFGDIAWVEESLVVPAGKATFDAQKKKVTWTIDSMPVGVDVLGLQFGLKMNTINPSQTNLMTKIRFKAKDVVTGQELTLVGDEILLER